MPQGGGGGYDKIYQTDCINTEEKQLNADREKKTHGDDETEEEEKTIPSISSLISRGDLLACSRHNHPSLT